METGHLPQPEEAESEIEAWVTTKLRKYPSKPKRGSSSHKKITSRQEVMVLYRTQATCCPILYIASVTASR